MLDDNSLEMIWDGLLSMKEDMVRWAFQQLEETERIHALTHLKRMAQEDGWHPLQKEAARTALGFIEDSGNRE